MSSKKLQYSEPLPILRSFESEDQKYVYGYAAIFDSPDMLGTVISRQVVESSLPHLKKFPAVRFMHRTPLGQIVFDQEVKGIKTKIDTHGFYVLCQIYDEHEKEWRMISKGGWGFSYGLLPAKDGVRTQCISPNECYETFVKGTLYEVSIVDTPAHPDAIAHVVQRILNGHKPKTPKRFGQGFRGMLDELYGNEEEPSDQKAERTVSGEGFLNMLEAAFPSTPQAQPTIIERKFPINLKEEFQKHEFPETCTELCPHHQCPYHRQENYGRPCFQQWNNYLNEGWWNRFKVTIAPANPNEQLLR